MEATDETAALLCRFINIKQTAWFGFEQPNRAILYFPFIWLPAIVVPTVFIAHLLSLWQLAKINR